MDTLLKNVVSRKIPLKFSIAVAMTLVVASFHNFVNFTSSHVRLQRFTFEILSFKNMQKKNRFFSKVHTRIHLDLIVVQLFASAFVNKPRNVAVSCAICRDKIRRES